jgi:hypothetical protein
MICSGRFWIRSIETDIGPSLGDYPAGFRLAVVDGRITCRMATLVLHNKKEAAVTVRGKIKNGKVVLEDPEALADGTEVEVRPAKKRKSASKPRKPKAKPGRRSLAERLANVIGKATGLPPDASVNHDHYLYGAPKQQ